VSIREQTLRQVKTDEACRAGDEKAHASVPIPKFACPCSTLNANFGNKRALATLWF
jgi:hypothetical protein